MNRPSTNPPVAVIDFETTGLSSEGGDRVVEVGIVRLAPDLRVEREYTTLVNPQRPIGGTKVHGIRQGDVDGAPTFDDIVADVGEMLAGAVIAGHNASAFSSRRISCGSRKSCRTA